MGPLNQECALTLTHCVAGSGRASWRLARQQFTSTCIHSTTSSSKQSEYNTSALTTSCSPILWGSWEAAQPFVRSIPTRQFTTTPVVIFDRSPFGMGHWNVHLNRHTKYLCYGLSIKNMIGVVMNCLLGMGF